VGVGVVLTTSREDNAMHHGCSRSRSSMHYERNSSCDPLQDVLQLGLNSLRKRTLETLIIPPGATSGMT
jgi:hypothetical protein